MTDVQFRPLLSFRCPKCNGFEFGSFQAADQSLTRTCHSTIYDPGIEAMRGCGYSWHERDDWKHFVLSFGDAQSFERAQAETSPVMIGGCVVARPAPRHEHAHDVVRVWQSEVVRHQSVALPPLPCSQCGGRSVGEHMPGCPHDPLRGRRGLS